MDYISCYECCNIILYSLAMTTGDTSLIKMHVVFLVVKQ